MLKRRLSAYQSIKANALLDLYWPQREQRIGLVWFDGKMVFVCEWLYVYNYTICVVCCTNRWFIIVFVSFPGKCWSDSPLVTVCSLYVVRYICFLISISLIVSSNKNASFLKQRSNELSVPNISEHSLV